MPSDCPNDRALDDFVAGALAPNDASSISDHLRGCTRCAGRARALECGPPTAVMLLRRAGRAEPETPPDPEYLAAVANLLQAPPLGALKVGDVIDDYRLVELLGEGGMGVVFRAVHAQLDKEVALKVIRGARALDPHMADRFRREMRAAGKLNHPNLVRATDARVAGGVPYLVTDYVPGTNLAHLVSRDGPLPPVRACELVRQAALGLHHAHEHGLVHRDVKPSNLLLGTDGIVRVLDLGLARLPDEPPPEPHAVARAGAPTFANDDTLTSPDQQLGTPHYTAPEQLRDSHRVDLRADVYGLGCTLVYLLTGRAHAANKPFPPGLPPGIWTKLLAENPAERFPTALDAAAALAAICAPPPAPVPLRRHREWIVPTALGATAALAVLAIVVANRSSRNAPGPIPAPVIEPLRALDLTALPTAPAPRAVPAPGALPMTPERAVELQKRWAEFVGQPIFVTNTLGMKLALVPPGEQFAMSKLYSVTVTRPYRIGTTEVTFGQYEQFVRATGHRTAAEIPKIGASFRTLRSPKGVPQPPHFHRLAPGWGKYLDNQPIAYLSWDDIERFLAWLSVKEGRTYRLPTHAEWVWACRAGTSAGFYWDRGDGSAFTEANKYAWTRSSGAMWPRPVGALLPNAWGLHDTIGNVEELVSDYVAIGFTPSGHATDPTGPPRSTNRLTCGWSYYEQPRVASPSEMIGNSAHDVVESTQGFRVVMER